MIVRKNPIVEQLSTELDLDYISALGLYMVLSDMERSGELEALGEDRFLYELGFAGGALRRKLSRAGRYGICDAYRNAVCNGRRIQSRNRQRVFRQRKRSAPLPPIPPITPEEKENTHTPASLRDAAPPGARVRGRSAGVRGPRQQQVPEGFEAFWAAYPRRVSKQAALKAWRSLGLGADTQEDILADLRRRRRGAWQDTAPRFIPHPSTYLNGRRWEDEDEAPPRREMWREESLIERLRRGGYPMDEEE